MVKFPSLPKISPNLLIAVAGLGAIFFITREIRGAGQDLAKFGENFKFPELPSLPDITFPEIKLPSLFPTSESVISPDPTQQTDQQQIDIFGRTLTDTEEDEINKIAKQLEEGVKVTPSGFDPQSDPTKFVPPVGEPQFTGREEDRPKFEAGLIDQFGRPLTTLPETSQTSIVDDIKKMISPKPELISELPTEQTFQSGGVGFIGGTIRENPIDTLSEVINLFPELSSSQARDFLNEFSGISPTDALRIDPDVSNITANIEGVNIQVPNIGVSDLESEELKSAKLTCERFGLNCELVNGMMA